MTEIDKIRIFISSPGDVEQERLISERVIKRLSDRYGHSTTIEGVFWEHEPLRATESYQVQITPPSQTDIAVCILWSRLGTRLPADITRSDGSHYNSGTEFEFEDAFLSKKAKGIPDLLVYRKTQDPVVSLSDETRLLESMRQKKALDKFIHKWFHGGDGSLVAAFHPFESTARFEELLETHLSKLIEEKLTAAGVPIRPGQSIQSVRTSNWQGCPYRGLEVFEEEHTDVFFGRTKAIGEIIEKLRKQELDNSPFVIVMGMSGSGKSSVISAGVIPLLTKSGVIEGVGRWRKAKFKPGSLRGDAILSLATALLSKEALPKLNASYSDPEALANALSNENGIAITDIKSALKDISIEDASKYSETLRKKSDESETSFAKRKKEAATEIVDSKLLLIVDQFEELFTDNNTSVEDKELFCKILSDLASSGLVWILASMRSDFYEKAVSIRALDPIHLDGIYNLMPPEAHEIGQMIRMPAFSAGLRFEEDFETGLSLDDKLREAASSEDGSLPLLQFTLTELYNSRSEHDIMTFEAYNALGGLEGALARKAETTYEALPDKEKKSFASVFRSLVSVSTSGETIAKRSASLSKLHKIEGAKGFCDAFIRQRLFVTDADDENNPTANISHEALIRAWPRLQSWLENDRELLRIQSRLSSSTREWESNNRNVEFLLNAGKPLEEAQYLNQQSDLSLSESELAYLSASQSRVNRTAKIKKLALSALVLLTFFSVGAALFANVQRNDALKSREVATANALEAEKAKNLAETTNQISEQRLSDVLTLEGQNALHRQDYMRAALFSGAAWMKNKSASNAYVLDKAMNELSVISRIYPLKDGLASANALSPDGKFSVLGTKSGIVTIRDVENGNLVFNEKLHESIVSFLQFEPSGKALLTSGLDNQVFILSGNDFSSRKILTGHKSSIIAAKFLGDDRLITTSFDKTARIWDAKTGDELSLFSFEDGRDISSFEFDETNNILFLGSSNGKLRRIDFSNVGTDFDNCISLDGPIVRIVSEGNKLFILSSSGEVIKTDLECAKIESKFEAKSSGNFSGLEKIEDTYLVWSSDSEFLFLDKENVRPVDRYLVDAPFGFSVPPSGRRILVPQQNGLQVIDSRSGQVLEQVKELSGTPKFLAASMDYKSIFVATDEGLGIDLSFEANENSANLRIDENIVSAEFDQSNLNVAFINTDLVPHIRVFANEESSSLNWPSSCDAPNKISFMSGTENILVQSSQCTVIFERGTQSLLKEFRSEDNFTGFSWDQEGGLLLYTRNGWSIYDPSNFSQLSKMDGNEKIKNAKLMPGGSYVIPINSNRNASLWYADSGKKRFSLKWNVTAIGMSNDRKIAYGLADGNISIERHTKTVFANLSFQNGPAHLGPIEEVTFSPQGSYVASRDDNGTIRIWKSDTGKLVHSFAQRFENAKSILFSPDENYFSVIWDDTNLAVFDSETGQPVKSIVSNTGLVAMSYSQNRGLLNYIQNDGSIGAIELPKIIIDDELLASKLLNLSPWGYAFPKRPAEDQWTDYSLSVLSEEVSNTTNNKAVATKNLGYAKLFSQAKQNIKNGHLIRAMEDALSSFEKYGPTAEMGAIISLLSENANAFENYWKKHDSRVEIVLFSPDGKNILSSDWSGNIKYWNAQTGEPVSIIEQSVGLNRAGFSPTEDKFFGASLKGTNIWNPQTGEILCSLPRITQNVSWVKNGSMIVGRTRAGSLKMWNNNCELVKDLTNIFDEIDVQTFAHDTDFSKIAIVSNEMLYLVEISNGNQIFTMDISDNPVSDITILSGQNLIAVLFENDDIVTMNWSGKEQARSNFPGAYQLHANGYGNRLLLLTSSGELIVAEPMNLEAHSAFWAEEFGTSIHPVNSPYIFVRSNNGHFEIIDTISGVSLGGLGMMATNDLYIRGTLSPNGNQLAVYDYNGDIRTYDTSKFQLNRLHDVLGEDEANTITPNKDTQNKDTLGGRTLEGKFSDRDNLEFFDGEKSIFLPGHDGPVTSVKLTNTHIIAGDIFGGITLRPYNDLSNFKKTNIDYGEITHLEVNKKEDLIFAASDLGVVNLFGLDFKEPIYSLSLGNDSSFEVFRVDEKDNLETLTNEKHFSRIPFYDLSENDTGLKQLRSAFE